MAMEAPISDPSACMNAPIRFSQFVVQTVQLSSAADQRCFTAKVALPPTDDACCHQRPEWLSAYQQLHSTYADSLCFKLSTQHASPDAIAECWRAEGRTLIAGALTPRSLEASLFYEPHLRQWLIIYRLDLETDGTTLRTILEEEDLYNELRNVFVISELSERPAAFITQVEEEARALIAHQTERLYRIQLDPRADITVVDSSGNITFFFPAAASPLSAPLTHGHERAERIGQQAEPLTVDETELYLFWGRFHTIISRNATTENAITRFMPIQFQAQLIWSYLSKANQSLQSIERQVISGDVTKKDSCMDFMDALNNSIHYAILMNEDFKRSIEGDHAKVYSPASRRWHVDETLQRAKEFAGFLSDDIDRSLKKKSLRSEERQNRALSAITILGVLALVETWSNYLSLLQQDSVEGVTESGFMHALFGSSDILLTFNTWFPIALFILCVVAVILLLIRR